MNADTRLGTPYASKRHRHPEETVIHRAAPTILALALLALLPVAASAQFTTFVAPPRKAVVDSAKAAIIAEQATRGDSAARMSLTDMKAWVDSAAGVGTPSSTVAIADTTSPATPAPVPSTPGAPQPSTTAFSDGAIAPNTASALPSLALGGLVLLVVGGVLLRLRSRQS